LVAYFRTPDEETKKKKYEETLQKTEFLMGKLEGFLVKNDGHFLKGKVN
jgi:hypothetical protein